MTLRYFALCLFLFCVANLSSAAQAQTGPITQSLDRAEEAYLRGRPDYALTRQALRQAEATDDLRLQARANRLQGKLDSTRRVYSKAIEFFQKADRLERQADLADAATALAASQAESKAAEQARVAALGSQEQTTQTLEEERSAARVQYITVIGICAAVLALGILAFLATVKKLRGEIAKAEEAREASEVGFAEARTQLTASARAQLNQTRKLIQTHAARIATAGPTSPANQLAAQDAALTFLAQSSFDTGDTHEVAMEAFYNKFDPDLKKLLNPNTAVTLTTNSMPLRLPLDQAVPVALIYTELIGNAFRHAFPGGGQGKVDVSMTKEGNSVSLTVADNGIGGISSVPTQQGLRLVNYLVSDLGGKIDYPATSEGGSVRVRFTAVPQRGARA